MSQSLEVVDLRTARDLQYVRDSEPLLRGVDGRLHTYVANPRTLTAKSLQVPTHTHRVKDGCLGVNISFGVKTLILRMPSLSFLSDCRDCLSQRGRDLSRSSRFFSLVSSRAKVQQGVSPIGAGTTAASLHPV